jgi:hypothetical protein
VKVLDVGQAGWTPSHMGLNGEAAGGIEFSIHIGVQQGLGFLAAHKQFSEAAFVR